MAAPRVIPKRQTPDGWAVATLHYSLVPDYDYEAACEGLSDEGIRQELEIDWSASKGKRVYPQFGVKTHQAVEPLRFNPHAPCYCGWDFGQVPAFVITQLNAFHQWLIFPSVSPGPDSSIGIYEFGQMVADHLQNEYCVPHDIELHQLKLIHFGDPAGAARPPRTGDRPRETQSCFEILNKGLTMHLGEDEDGAPRTERRPGWGWKIRPGAVNITARLEAVRARLQLSLRDGLPALVVDPGAQAILDGFSGGYCYPQRADGTYALDPGKSWFSHCLLGDTLIETDCGFMPISIVRPGTRVMTRKGWRRVKRSGRTGRRKLVEVHFSNGTFLRCTDDHKIWADGEWVMAGSLRYNQVCDVRPSPSRAAFTPATPTRSTTRIGSITAMAAAVRRAVCTAISGLSTTGRSRQGAISTMTTAIRSITSRRTSSASPRLSMGPLMPPWVSTRPSEFVSTWIRSVPSLWNGIARRKGESGTGSTGTRPLSPHLSGTSYVSAVAAHTRAEFSTIATGTVVGPASPQPAATQAWMTRREAVPNADQTSPATVTLEKPAVATCVLGVIAYPGSHLVYDLEVAGAHEFYANGILAHNSMDALSYIATRLFHVTKDEDEDDHQSRAPEFVSHAAARD